MKISKVYSEVINYVEVTATTFSDDKDEVQIKVYHHSIFKTFGYAHLSDLKTVDKDCKVDMEILLETIDLAINGSDDECEDHLNEHYQSELYGVETYNGWVFDDTTPRETLYWVIGKETVFSLVNFYNL